MKITIINGPNLNLLGAREPAIYGKITFEEFLINLKQLFPEVIFDYFQSNIEGELIDKIQQIDHLCDGIILNAAGYSHTSVAISDAVKAISTPVIEVHISNIFAREHFRHTSLVGAHCIGSISGFGLESYTLAVHYFTK